MSGFARPAPDAGPSLMWTATATVSVPTITHDSSGAPSRSYADTANVPCDIQASGSTEQQKFGAGHAHAGSQTFTGYFPVSFGGSALSIPASAKVTSGGVTYRAIGAGQMYADGIQTVPLEVVT